MSSEYTASPVPGQARRHSALKNFFEDVKKGFLKEDVVLAGHKFTIHTLNDEEESWSDGFIRSTSAVSYVSSRKDPRLSCAIKAVDDIPVDQLFEPDTSMSDSERERIKEPTAKLYWLRLQLMLFLSKEIPPPVTDALYKKYEELSSKRDEALSTALKIGPNS